MRKPSEIIRLAASHWRYPTQDRFLCIVLQDMSNHREITDEECDAAIDAVCEALGGCTTLSQKIGGVARLLGITDQYAGIEGRNKYPNDLRLQFWAVLVWDLSRKGQ